MKTFIINSLLSLLCIGFMNAAVAAPTKKPKPKAYKTTWQVVKVAARGFISKQLPQVYVSKSKCLIAAKLKNQSGPKNTDGSHSSPWHCVQVKLQAVVVDPK